MIVSVFLASWLASWLSSAGYAAQPPRQPNAAQLARQIDRLGVTGTVLYIAAHPDDENTKLLAWLANDRLVRTGYLSITRGDGGQNLLGAEQGVDLGIIRTQELLAARRLDGAEQLFTRARDFGFSKSPDEALAIWGRDEILADVVWAIRRFKPDVVITRFPTAGMDTHGHHTASGILAGEAFALAADPHYRPDQVAKVGTWKAVRLVQNVPSFGGVKVEAKPGDLTVDVGVYDPALGLSYGELAADSRSMHKSQGFGAARSRDASVETFRLLAGAPMAHSLFDGVVLDWGRVPGAGKLAGQLARAQKGLDPRHPETALPALASAHAELARLPVSGLTRHKMVELSEVMVACAGLHLDATSAVYEVAPGGQLPLTISARNRSSAKVSLVNVQLTHEVASMISQPVALTPSAPFTLTREVPIPLAARVSNPYWLEAVPTPGRFVVDDPELVGLPETPPMVVRFDLRFGNEAVSVERVWTHRWVDPVAGERQRSVEVTPPVTLVPAVPLLLFTNEQPRELRVHVKSSVDGARGGVRLEVPPGFRAEPAQIPIALAETGAEMEVVFAVTGPKNAAEGQIRVVADLDGAKWSRSLSRIEYAHIPIQTRFPEATVKAVRFRLAHTKQRIGYIEGAGDEVASALRQVGYEVTLIDDETLAHGSLARFEAIVTGVRAFNVNARLPFYHGRLMDYVARGGVLVVQYNTNNRLSKVPAEIGPYPFSITQGRVTDENALVAIAVSPVLERPNVITAEDFAGWVQERGLYFGGSWDANYETPLTMSDAGDKQQKGSLLVAKLGKGHFVYTGLAFFRQLPAGVPGAFRLFANLLDL